MERECASGQPPVGREIRPVVLSGEEVLEIVVLIEAPGGLAQTCQGNPWHRTTIDVGEPIGERTLVRWARFTRPGATVAGDGDQHGHLWFRGVATSR